MYTTSSIRPHISHYSKSKQFFRVCLLLKNMLLHKSAARKRKKKCQFWSSRICDTLRITPLPNQTSPATFKLSSPIILGIDLKRSFKSLTWKRRKNYESEHKFTENVAQKLHRFRKYSTFLSTGPNSMDGSMGFSLAGFRVRVFSIKVYRSDCIAEIG